NSTDEDEEEENVIGSGHAEVERKTSHGCRIYDKITPQENFIRVNSNSWGFCNKS
ncbi:unnamed protein product, partial [Rotaria magnacalcarata]